MTSWAPVTVYALLIMGFLGFFAWRHMDDSIGRQPFVMLVFLAVIMLASDYVSRCYIYPDFPHIAVAGCTAITFIMLPAIGAEWHQYVRSVLTAEERARMRPFDMLVTVLAAFGIVVILMSPITSWVYYFDSTGMYYRGDMFIAPASTFFLILILVDSFLLFEVHSLGRTSKAALFAFPIPSIIGAVLAVAFPNVPWIPLGVTVSMVALFANIQNTGMGRDYLTGLYNRRKLEELLNERVERARLGRSFAAIMMDVDNFKRINDTLGHSMGDIALAETARLLKHSVRSGDAVARFGGDEFFVLLDIDDVSELEDVVARITEEEEAFATGNDGAIYGAQIARLREQGRVGGEFAFNPQEPLYTAWDLGLSDHTSIWLVQNYGGNVYWLNHYSANQLPLEHFAGKIREWEARYGPVAAHFLPHDAAHRDPHGHSYVESLAHEGIHAVRVVPRTPDIWRGINSLRGILTHSWFHRDTLHQRVNPRGEKEPSGLSCLEMYRTAPAGASGTCRETPVHDACSHSADAARMFAEALAHGMVYPVQLRLAPRRARM